MKASALLLGSVPMAWRGFVVVIFAVSLGLGSARADRLEGAKAYAEQLSVNLQLALQGEDEQEKRERLIAIIIDSIDVDLIGRAALGRHGRRVGLAEREAYLVAFREWAILGITQRFLLLSSEEITIVGAEPLRGADTKVTVATEVEGEEFVAEFRVRDYGEGRFLFIDVTFGGVSMVSTMRSEFSSYVDENGIEALIMRLRDQAAALRVDSG